MKIKEKNRKIMVKRCVSFHQFIPLFLKFTVIVHIRCFTFNNTIMILLMHLNWYVNCNINCLIFFLHFKKKKMHKPYRLH